MIEPVAQLVDPGAEATQERLVREPGLEQASASLDATTHPSRLEVRRLAGGPKAASARPRVRSG